MQARVVAQVTIAASPAQVFKYLVDLKRHFLWNPHLQSIAPMGTLKEGVTYKTTSLLLGIKVSGTNKISRLVTNKELEIQNGTGAIEYRVTYKLHTDQQKTQVICTTVVRTESRAFVFTKPVLQLLAKRELGTDLKALKIAVEQQLT